MADLIGQRLGQYEILAQIGSGGMAMVYRARQASMKRDVAIKVIEPRIAQTPEFVRRFEREAQTIAALSHLHILKVFDYGAEGDLVYLVMELLNGGSLTDLIRKGPLPVDRATQLLDQIASALDYAHRRGIIHRDLKPQNVLLDEEGNAFLTDFGIAKILNETSALTQPGLALGTPLYMSPEQWLAKPIDARADLYALGIMLFEMLSGKVPFNADTPYGMMHLHVTVMPPSIHQLRPEIPASIDAVLNKALAKDREQRFQSANELAIAFKSALSGIVPPGLELPVPMNDAPTLPPSIPAVVRPIPSAPKQWQSRTIPIVMIAIIVILAGIAGVLVVNRYSQREILLNPTIEAVEPNPYVASAIVATATELAASSATRYAAQLTSAVTAIPSATATLTATPTNLPTMTPSPTTTPTLLPSATVNLKQTVDMQVKTQLAIIASFTKTPTPTIPPTATPQPTFTPITVSTDTPEYQQIANVGTETQAAVMTSSANPRISGQTVYLGVAGQTATNTPGTLINTVTPGSPAEKAGIKVNDVVISADGTPLNTVDDFRKYVQTHQPGDTLVLTVQRGNTVIKFR